MSPIDVSASVSVTWPQALAWRLQRHLLEPVGDESPAGVVRRLGAVLSMDESRAELAVRTRRRASEAGELRQALVEGAVVKAFAFRGAVHYLAPEEGGDVLALRAAGRQWERRSWVEHYGLTAEAWPDFRAAVRSALAEGPLTLGELADALALDPRYRHLKPILDADGWALVKALTWQGDMSIGPSRDGRTTFQRLDDNPRWGGIPELDVAGPRAVAAYLRTYGPATTDHVHHWFGSGLSAGRRRIDGWLAELDEALARVDVEGTTALVVAEDVEPLLGAAPTGAVRLLPGHDQWVMGPGTADPHVTPPDLRDSVTRKSDLVVVDGVVAGTWTRADDEVVVAWRGAGPCPDTALAEEVDRLGSLLGRELSLRRST
ncbi:winged helix DNA-binding domain-containing protein [Nocardioides sp. HDW12B]|uniref:DNA glycosylase AlkZ-like family protein n=1 Tax=Nocardioides sp. HDW12B TaxID=2714939 RepID=UPI00140E5627|nr:crosslink repair DNA glycosylase YcaQ family protein [Nocardioides sp. HDW12B]QIK67360.1 winged helix DNA-binding domain-containing protein [Nocardioides sp. HDW12B]